MFNEMTSGGSDHKKEYGGQKSNFLSKTHRSERSFSKALYAVRQEVAKKANPETNNQSNSYIDRLSDLDAR